jgi:hypothetical protein
MQQVLDDEQQQQPGLAQMAQQSYGTWAPLLSQQDNGVINTQAGDVGRGSFTGLDEGGLRGLFGGGAVAPEDAKYFDAYGGYKMDDPRQVAEDSGLSLAQLASGFLPRMGVTGIGYEYGSDKGGFFNAADMSRLLGKDVPGMATFNASGPSTNNWRLLGMGPGWIMRNGELINSQAGEVRSGGFSGADMGVGRTAEEGMAALNGSYLGSGANTGTPNRWGDSFYWPGARTGGFSNRSPAGTNV